MLSPSHPRKRIPSLKGVKNKFIPVPPELTAYPQWVVWRYGKKRPNDKYEKVPISPWTDRRARVNDSKTCGTAGEAIAVLLEQNDYEGIGFVLRRGDPCTVIDLDGCRNPHNGKVEEWALRIVRMFSSLTFVSPSGTGLHIWVVGTLPVLGFNKQERDIEGYSANRFITFTGEVYAGEAIEERQAQLENLYQELYPEQVEAADTGARESSSERFAGEDEDVLELACNKGMCDLFVRLYDRGDWSGFGSQSDADLALCGALAFWTGRDEKRMDRLFRRSALMRDKWDEIHHAEGSTYGQKTIERAIERCQKVYTATPGQPERIVRERMERLAKMVNTLPYDWRGGDTDRKGLLALINTGWVWGKHHGDDGVVFYISMRDYGLEAAISNRQTQSKSLGRLEENLPDIVEVLEWGKGRKATKVLVKASPNVNPKKPYPTPCVSYGSGLATRKMRGPYYPPRGEDGLPTYDVAPLANRLPTRCGQVLDIVGSLGGAASLRQIATVMKMDTSDRRYKLKKRYIEPLIAEGLLEEHDGIYRIAADSDERFEWYLEKSGCNRAERRGRRAWLF